MAFVKRTDLVGKEFSVKRYLGKSYKAYDKVNKKYVESPTPQKGLSAVYKLDIDNGTVEISKGNLGDMLVGIFENEGLEIAGRKFKVGSNGKTGEEIRYYFDIAKEPVQYPEAPQGQPVPVDERENGSEHIPF